MKPDKIARGIVSVVVGIALLCVLYLFHLSGVGWVLFTSIVFAVTLPWQWDPKVAEAFRAALAEVAAGKEAAEAEAIEEEALAEAEPSTAPDNASELNDGHVATES